MKVKAKVNTSNPPQTEKPEMDGTPLHSDKSSDTQDSNKKPSVMRNQAQDADPNIQNRELVYTQTVPESRFQDEVGHPGEFPFTRGPYPTMYRGRLWTMRQYAGFGDADQSNERFKMLLEKGQTGLSVAFDLPTQMGMDSDDPRAHGEVGKVGVAIDTVEDMKRLFNGIPLDSVSTSMTINAPAMILLAMYVVAAEEQGVKATKLRGTIQNDILKEYIARGTYIFAVEPSMRLITDTFSYCSEHLPLFNTISISGYHIREAGATAVQELAFTLANGISYVQAALDAGLDIDKFGCRISFFFSANNDLFEEVAKFRAARRLYARIIKERFGSQNPKAQAMRMHVQTSGAALAAQQPRNNIVRVAIQAIAAVLGGTQSLHTNSFDEALSLPTEEACTLALRTQQIIAHETGVPNTVDPLGGSCFVEELTDKLEKETISLIEEIEEFGGMPTAIMQGFPQREIHNSAYQFQREIEKQERIIVGVNRFVEDEDRRKFPVHKVAFDIEHDQRERLRKLRKQRDNARVTEMLDELLKVANSGENLFPAVIHAVRARASIGEIVGILRDVFGAYSPAEVF